MNVIRNIKILDKIKKDKRIKFEGKIIYSYLYTKGFNRLIVDLNVGELQPYLKIKNKRLKNNLQIFESCKYLIYDEYDTGMYSINLSR